MTPAPSPIADLLLALAVVAFQAVFAVALWIYEALQADP